MIGWTADFFRFWWALAYWNTRKTWFRLQGAHRDSCPCQNFSDFGHALDSRCEASAHWADPRRFRKVCPLLVRTADGWRCRVDAERVRPFWGRALLFLGGGLVALHLLGAGVLQATLRLRGHPVGYLALALPWRWPELRHSEEERLSRRARAELGAGNPAAAIRDLTLVGELDSRNWTDATTLARLRRDAGDAAEAEAIYERLMQDVPEQRAATARLWFQALLARGDYEQVKTLALAMLSEDSGHRETWLQALVFACRQTADAATLDQLRNGEHGLPDWCLEVTAIETLLLQGHSEQALARLNHSWSRPMSPYLPAYQVERLVGLGHPDDATALIDTYGDRLPREEASFLRWRTRLAQPTGALAATEADQLLARPPAPALLARIGAVLLVRPASSLVPRYLASVRDAAPSLADETPPLHQLAYLIAVSTGDLRAAQPFADVIERSGRSQVSPLTRLAEALRTGTPAAANELLPRVALPVEVIYALRESRERAR